MAQLDSKKLLPARIPLTRKIPPRTSSAPPAAQPRERKKETLLLPKLLSSSASAAERSMLRSMMRPEVEWKGASGSDRLRKHEFEDDSDEEEKEKTERRARSASYSNLYRNQKKKETPPLRFVREKSGTTTDKKEKEISMRRLLFDTEFGCYYDPISDRYFTVENT